HDTNPDAINIIHHGGAVRIRQLEDYIQIIKLCDSRFKLNFMLTGQDTAYIQELKALAQKDAPGRVEFHEPVAPEQVVEAIARFDIGLCFKKPLCFNEKYCMPNKFFDSIVAGLAVVSGPSPELSDIIGHYKLGKVAPSFSLKDVARTINSLSGQQIQAMRRAALKAAQEINADRELGKLVDIFADLFNAK
ncbi:MAG: glycosyltransferase, partial [Desulfatibacillaceae bacterium]|nr:glycosyltransferase [Desulfatibacillaceae bacterium]